jgi:hypothetical protein
MTILKTSPETAASEGRPDAAVHPTGEGEGRCHSLPAPPERKVTPARRAGFRGARGDRARAA